MVYITAIVDGQKIVLADANGSTKEYRDEEAAFILSGLRQDYTADDLLREVYAYEDMVGAWLLNEATQGRFA